MERQETAHQCCMHTMTARSDMNDSDDNGKINADSDTTENE